MCIRNEGAEHEHVKLGVANRTWPLEDREREREKVTVRPGSRGCKAGHETDNCGEVRGDGEGYVHYEKGGRTWVCQVGVANRTWSS